MTTPTESQDIQSDTSSPILPDSSPLTELSNRQMVIGLRFLAFSGLLQLFLFVFDKLSSSYPAKDPSRLMWGQIHGSTFWIQAIGMVVALWFLWRASKDAIDDISGLALFALQFLASAMLLGRTSVSWLPHLTSSYPKWLLVYGAPLSLTLQGVVWVGIAWKLSRWGGRFKSFPIQFASYMLFIIAVFHTLMITLFMMAALSNKAYPSWMNAMVSLLSILPPILGLGVSALSWPLSTKYKLEDAKQLTETGVSWLSTYHAMNMVYWTFGIQLILGIAGIVGVFGFQLGRLFPSSRWFVTYFPINSLFVSALLIGLFWQLSQNKEAPKASFWFRLTAISMLLTFLGMLGSFAMQANVIRSGVLPLHKLLAPQASTPGMLGSLFAGITLLTFLTGLKYISKGLEDFERADKVGNLRWVLVGYSMFAPLPVILFAVLAANRTMHIKEGAGAIIPYFVGLCYLIFTTTLLLLVFFNVSSTLRLIQQRRLQLKESTT